MRFDVAIIGGGPAGSTVGTLLKKLNPAWKIGIFEAVKFPRDHVGESLLPGACQVLDELGAWNEVEAAGFPVKLGGLYRWGMTEELFPLAFLREPYSDAPRPAKYEGQRRLTAFQVDRSIFDKILLDHAASAGCRVFEETPVARIDHDGDRIVGLELGRSDLPDPFVKADWYVDASGNRAMLRKTLGIGVDAPTALRNIAIYDYWQDANWGTREGVDGTNIHVMSIRWGWIWFIAMGRTRTSVGLVTSADYYKKSGLSTEELYLKAISEEPVISKLLAPARREGNLKADSDWSYIADRLVGENWFLAGDSGGFADPILSAGLTLAMTGAQKVAYSIFEVSRGKLDAAWIKSEYDRIQRGNIRDHIRFADYWYSTNARFTDLTEYCAQIAGDAGLDLSPDEAFRWLGIGGFSNDAGDNESPTSGTFRLSTVKGLIGSFAGDSPDWKITKIDRIRLNLDGAVKETAASYRRGGIEPLECYRRGRSRLFLRGLNVLVINAMQSDENAARIFKRIYAGLKSRASGNEQMLQLTILEVMEAMLLGGWIEPA